MADPPSIVGNCISQVPRRSTGAAAKQTHPWLAIGRELHAGGHGGCQVGASVNRPPSAKPMLYISTTPKTKLIRPDATRSRQLNFGRLTAVNANGADRMSVISIIPTTVPSPHISRD